ncbi:MAG: Mur ligase family protein, partial [Bacteroidota bacterium]
MNYQQTLDYLYQQLPMYQRVGAKAFKKDLTNTIQLCEALGNPQQQFPSIHIAGTNGKGSTSHMLAAILQAKGLKVGLYTSPHYRDFRERIKINGTFISEEAVMEWVSQHQPLFERIQPSFFEITVALAFHYFAEAAVDIAVIETGLGGRLDSTNVLSPILSVITNIDYDHMDMLGDTLAQIAGEKAGIIKPNIPVVIGQTHLETRDVFLQKAAQTNSPIHFADQHFAIAPDRIADSRTHYDVYHNGLPLYED